jgi:hypothetical protein
MHKQRPPGAEWASSSIAVGRLGRDDRGMQNDPVEASRNLCAVCEHDGLEELAQVIEAWLERYAPRGQTMSDVDPSFASMHSSSSR